MKFLSILLTVSLLLVVVCLFELYKDYEQQKGCHENGGYVLSKEISNTTIVHNIGNGAHFAQDVTTYYLVLKNNENICYLSVNRDTYHKMQIGDKWN